MLVAVEGERDGETLKLRVQSIESLDAAAGNVEKGVKVVVDGATAFASRATLDEIKQLLRPGGKSTVCLGLALSDAGKELEFALPGGFDVSPAQKSALRTIPGVLEVIDL